ncbi:hypothetical protein NJ7G_2717 [Natrinema sp. J7-2]|nr:hypothetical protein NJ7G_2717 [Natrinema sp. J7-2]
MCLGAILLVAFDRRTDCQQPRHDRVSQATCRRSASIRRSSNYARV